MKHSIKEIVKGNAANLVHICEGIVLFKIEVPNISTSDEYDLKDSIYLLEINSTDDDWKSTFILPAIPAIQLMRWIRKGIDNDDGSFMQTR